MTQRSWAPREQGSLALLSAIPAPRAPLSAQTTRPASPAAPVAGRPPPARSWSPQPHQPAGLPARAVAAPADLRVEAGYAGRWTTNLAVVLAVVALLTLAVGPHSGTYRTTTMLTGSMSPSYPAGSLLVTTPQPVADLAAGQVITFHAPTPDRPVITHRVVSVDRSGPRPVIVTKGDANTGNDPWQAAVNGSTVWRVRGVVPHVGTAIRALREPWVSFALSRGLPLALLVLVLVTLWRPERRDA